MQSIAGMKRSINRNGWFPHPHLTSEDVLYWNMLCTTGSEERFYIMRIKDCPKCGTPTQRCGCPTNRVQCNGLDKCPNEGVRLLPYFVNFLRTFNFLLQRVITCDACIAIQTGDVPTPYLI